MMGRVMYWLVPGTWYEIRSEQKRKTWSFVYIASMARMSHKDCGLNYGPISQMVHSHVKKLANKIDVLDQSEECIHQ
jgi:hypothetical protein